MTGSSWPAKSRNAVFLGVAIAIATQIPTTLQAIASPVARAVAQVVALVVVLTAAALYRPLETVRPALPSRPPVDESETPTKPD